jgi:hypothetical protein
MKRSSFIKSLGALIGAAFIPESKSLPLRITSTGFEGIGYPHPYERMRMTSSGNVGMGMLNPNQILEVTKRVNGGMSPLYKRIK